MAQDGYFTADLFSNPLEGAAAGSQGLEKRGFLAVVCVI